MLASTSLFIRSNSVPPASSRVRQRARLQTHVCIEALEVRVMLSGMYAASEERMFRFNNPGANFTTFTADKGEFDIVVSTLGFTNQTNFDGFNYFRDQVPGSTIIHRLYNPNNSQHYLTLSDFERDYLVSVGWEFVYSKGYMFTSAQPDTVEIFHFYNNQNGDHVFIPRGDEATALLASGMWTQAGSLGFAPFAAPLAFSIVDPYQLTATEVDTLLKRAAAASASNDAIIAVVDRNGTILGVRVESGVSTADINTLVFSVDGAVAKARTAAFFSNNQGALTSRTIRHISQSTITQSEVESNPNDPTRRGPGWVAPIGVGGHFPPGIINAPPVDLFRIEHTNRDSLLMPGVDGIKGTPDDVALPSRFNADYIVGQEILAPESYGAQAEILNPNTGTTNAWQSRGIATLPGGIPLYRNGKVVGGIGVFFPGPNGYASYEQGFVPGVGQTAEQRNNASRVLEAEAIAVTAAGSATLPDRKLVLELPGLPLVAGLDIPVKRIDLVGITLQSIGPVAGPEGVNQVLLVAASAGAGDPNDGTNLDVGPGGIKFRDGKPVPEGWLVAPKNSLVDPQLTAAEVNRIINQGIGTADRTRAQIRELGSRTRMVLSVADSSGEVLGLYRMSDSTVFSIDVAVAKARNTEYYADPAELNPADQLPGYGTGIAFTNRTFRFLAEPRYPAGIDGQTGPWSVLNEAGINAATAEDLAGHVNPMTFTTPLGFDAAYVGRNFRNSTDSLANQNGVVWFPGSTPIYVGGDLVGGFGVSGDGVDQDDVVTYYGSLNNLPPAGVTRADQTSFRDVRLPYFKFPRNPFAG